MSVEIIQQRLLDYDCKTLPDQENALKEIVQEIALMALSRAGFFSLLNNALRHAGAWKAQNISVTKEWFLRELKSKINNMDWDLAKKDVERFFPLASR